MHLLIVLFVLKLCIVKFHTPNWYIRNKNRINQVFERHNVFALVIACLGGQFGINCPNAFWKFQKSRGWFIIKIARTKHNKHSRLKLIYFNGGPSQNNSVNSTMLTTINRLTKSETTPSLHIHRIYWKDHL